MAAAARRIGEVPFDSLVTKQMEAKVKRSGILVWRDLSLDQAEALLQYSTAQQLSQETIKLVQGESGLFGGTKLEWIVADMYRYLILFARKKVFAAPQLSVLFSIQKSVHDACKSTPYDNLDETFALFKQLLITHSVNHPPFSVHMFDVDQVKDISDYFLSTYFKHFRMYKYAFTNKQRLNIRFKYPDLPDTPPPESASATEQQGSTQEYNSVPQTREDSEEEEMPTEETPSVSSKETGLQKLIESHLSGQLQSLRATVSQEMEEYNLRVSEKISSLEASIGKTKTKKK